MIYRSEVVVYFTDGDAADAFVREHVVQFSSEPWPNPAITGFAIRTLGFPSDPRDALEIRVNEYGAAPAKEEPSDV